MSLTVRCLGSGSSGNALLIETGSTAIVVDCGLHSRALDSGLRAADRDLATIDALLLTHEHVDHVRALPRFVTARVPVIATPGTATAASISPSTLERLPLRGSTQIGDVTITSLAVSHDAAEPCGYHLQAGEGALTIITDLGCGSPELAPFIAVSDLVIVEANHDEAMVRSGPYPTHLKRRILSSTGHLSNEDCGRLLTQSLVGANRLPTVWLAHLSATNNRPVLARQTVQRALAGQGLGPPVIPLPHQGHDRLWCLDQQSASVVQLAMVLT